jgi:Lrp/AsnC family transcriptional regulator for asnA, asnC and gidA
MDEIDVKILKELTLDPQIAFLRIAEKTGVSPKTVQKKYQKLKENHTILRSSITIDLSKIGYQGKAYLMITNTPGQDKIVTINALSNIPDVFLITDVLGEFDILAIAAVKDYTHVLNMVNTIRNLPSVEKAEAAFVTDAIFPAGKEFNELLL